MVLLRGPPLDLSKLMVLIIFDFLWVVGHVGVRLGQLWEPKLAKIVSLCHEAGVEPNVVTYNALITTCARSKDAVVNL